ncbi:type III secretion protein [Pseudomonas sp. MPR-R5A]|jgi:hypothetical protein|uniref:Type III secretion protein n=1 Tax=Pseudomonas veronii TaxID=76761 RepID=A0A5M8F6Q8_PSEVE|nr:type III secretion protein [Pseudomonas veronii]PMX04911.1 type III secretion protein [Pseudomonas sp. MPBC4-3]PMX21305.1 type III secretion protein [Pseudomonas sp. GW460-12]PMX31490.1 type III secretion protein [Pseudomonas sp. MPR-R2A4]PMX38743.1 type III secretion protein [Pseudomonas sp. MPR-R2A7]PMX48517.1 type III secretion protein [Pseudomonas sp. FW301-21B01]PMX51601.1 type III secretion protein [Pseudomonas sp. MPR-R2A6]PMX90506.1 type III secretion protein [Pseudomonas sp. MPR-
MVSSSCQQKLADCLAGREQHVLLFEQDDEVSVQCSEHRVLLGVQLTHSRLEHYSLQSWHRLGQSSLAHFQGALALAPATGHLWLLQGLPRDCSQEHLLKSLEALFNQRDTWRSVVARLARPGPPSRSLSLRKLPY